MRWLLTNLYLVMLKTHCFRPFPKRCMLQLWKYESYNITTYSCWQWRTHAGTPNGQQERMQFLDVRFKWDNREAASVHGISRGLEWSSINAKIAVTLQWKSESKRLQTASMLCCWRHICACYGPPSQKVLEVLEAAMLTHATMHVIWKTRCLAHGSTELLHHNYWFAGLRVVHHICTSIVLRLFFSKSDYLSWNKDTAKKEYIYTMVSIIHFTTLLLVLSAQLQNLLSALR